MSLYAVLWENAACLTEIVTLVGLLFCRDFKLTDLREEKTTNSYSKRRLLPLFGRY